MSINLIEVPFALHICNSIARHAAQIAEPTCSELDSDPTQLSWATKKRPAAVGPENHDRQDVGRNRIHLSADKYCPNMEPPLLTIQGPGGWACKSLRRKSAQKPNSPIVSTDHEEPSLAVCQDLQIT